MVLHTKRSYIGMKSMALTRRNSRSNVSSTRTAEHFMLCARNQDYPASLEVRKLYPVIRDTATERHCLVRVIDES